MTATRAQAREIVPGRLYQRGQFLTWPVAQKRRMLDEHGITLVVNLWHKIDPDLSPEQDGRIYLNWLTSPSDVPPHADLLVDIVTRLVQAGHVALIHCEAGRGRSVWLSARVMARLRGLSGIRAVEEIRRLLPSESMRPVLIADLEAQS